MALAEKPYFKLGFWLTNFHSISVFGCLLLRFLFNFILMFPKSQLLLLNSCSYLKFMTDYSRFLLLSLADFVGEVNLLLLDFKYFSIEWSGRLP
jgi:hypothetical protein